MFIIAPGVAMFWLTSMQTGFGAGIRYVLPAFPFAFLVGSAAFYRGISHRIRLLAALALVLGPIASLYTFPHSLCYFNQFPSRQCSYEAHGIEKISGVSPR